MAVFYLLPPRPLLGQHFAGYLRALFPGLEWADPTWTELADTVASAARLHDGVYVVCREELPEGEDVERALADGYGAEPGDEVVEVSAGARPGELGVRRWRLAAVPVG
jgi:hypothetical protein